MASLESLPPDQRAVLELVLRRGRNYDQIAEMLAIDRAGVRARALQAFDALGPQTGVPPERRALLTDYLLGQLPEAVSNETREHLRESPNERAWARVLASELAPVASSPLPEIPPATSAGAAPQPVAAAPEPATARADRAPARGSEPGPYAPERLAASQPPGGAPPPRRVSRLGGAVLLGVGIAVVVVVIVLATSGGGSKHPSTASTAAAAPTTSSATAPTSTTAAASASTTATTTASSTGSDRVIAKITLVPATAGSQAAGKAEVLQQGTSTGLAIVATHVPANTKSPANAYAVWLANSPADAHFLGFVNPGVGSNGQLTTAGVLPANAAHYKQVLITLETTGSPTVPGKVVLEGPLTGL